MKGFFSVDGFLYNFMQSLTDVFVISILWLLCSIPIVTLGPATIAGFSVTLKMADNTEGHVGRQFLKAFRDNLKNGIPFSFVFLIAGYIVWLDFSLFAQLEDSPIVMLMAGIVAAFIYYLSFLYAFALQARYENTMMRTLKNSFDIAIRYWVSTIALTCVLVVEVVMMAWNQVTMFVGLLIGPGCVMLTISGFALYMFRRIEIEPGAVVQRDEDKE